MSKNKPVVVIGLMGSGKTTVGRLIADALHLPLSDSDPFLRARYGGTAKEIAAREGADVLHHYEAQHVLLELDGEPKVIAAAASTVEDPRVRTALREVFVVWLDADDAVLAERMKSGDHRPGFDPKVMRARREPFFKEVADVHCDVGVLRPEQVRDEVLREMRSRGLA
ncbi:Shikimate kinase [Nonomuraea coxensis DSM 45129]|uniref:Shikimate kinase n=1 Tax=Nonomuraea coxensis DSM 45129 TaxID=1122611 RepID=A0ABX8U9S0_9ACTN|nr:shikimate kinase [Nonomuraea coxensis]QYC44482.1 Shikimate kinase [Nonomuraea coxensis DSM 45129]